MDVLHPTSRDRLTAALAAILLPGLLLWALASGLTVQLPHIASAALETFAIAPLAPPPPAERPQPRRASPRKEGRAAPPNFRADPTQIVSPPPVLPLPSVIPAAPIKGAGDAPQAGAATVVGPGTGAGGVGNGLGAGNSGEGNGGGGGTPWQQIAGIRDGDWPAGAEEGGVTGTVGVRFVIGVKGRLTDCVVTRSSGDVMLDRGTCPLLLKRLRYRPERDSGGRAVPATVEGTQEWYDR